MKKMIKPFAAICMVALTFTACKKEVATVAEDEISQETLSKISNLGFGSSNVQKIDEGYLVEGDIILSEGQLNETPNSPILRIAEEEQYRTNNLVTGLPRTITVSVSGTVNSGFSSAVDAAIARYNTENLQLKFQRVSSGGAINIRLVNTGQYIASAGFPSGGNPYPEIKYANRYTSYSAGFMTTVLAHEMGHCIGFRHTDYMNRAYSCGSGGNEGASTVGAVHIPGTPTGPDAASWMLACLSASTNRPFNSNDKVALNYLY
ncbi:MAG TPA: M57 family metalloprotease [Flavisolibacter sp.]